MFLTEDDFKTIIDDDYLKKITGNNPSLISDSILIAVDEMTSYLTNRYDIAVAFDTTGSQRNQFLVMRCADLALYHLYSRVTPKNVPDIRGIRYTEAISWLKEVNRGNVHLNIPLKPISNQTGYLLFGGNPQFRFR